MRRNIAKVLIFVFSVYIILSFVIPTDVAQATDYNNIKVKLASMGQVSTINIKVHGNFHIAESSSYSLKNGTSYSITTSSSGIKISDGSSSKYVGAKLTIVNDNPSSLNNYITLNNTKSGWLNYPCTLVFMRNGSYIDTICDVDLETYLIGVVAYEMSPNWPMEALKAQAVAARTYACRYIKDGNVYDVVDTTSNQVYKGYNPDRDAKVLEAVNATKSQVMMWGDTLADGVYSASNGGQTMTRVPKWGTVNYYHELKDDPYDKANLASPKFIFTFPKVITASNPIDTRLGNLIKEQAVIELAKKGISTNVNNIRITGTDSVVPHTLPEPTKYGSYPSGSYQFQKVDVTAVIDYSGTSDTVVTEPTKITTGVVKLESSTRMRIRSGPSTSYTIAGYINNGETLDVYSIRSDGWMAIKYGNISGYVMQKYVVLAPYDDDLVDDSQTTLSIPGTVLGDSSYYASVFSEPNIGSSVVDALSGGTSVTIIDYLSNGWLKIRTSSSEGYIGEGSVSYDKSLLDDGLTVTTAEGERVKVTLLYSKLQEVFASDSSFLKYHKILMVDTSDTSRNINLTASRYGHGIGMSQRGAQQMANTGMMYTDILDFYYHGTKLVNIHTQNPIAPVTPEPTVTPSPTPEPTPSPTPIVTTTRIVKIDTILLEIYKKSDYLSAVIGYLPNDALVNVVGEIENGWAYIQYKEIYGYVSADKLEEASSN